MIELYKKTYSTLIIILLSCCMLACGEEEGYEYKGGNGGSSGYKELAYTVSYDGTRYRVYIGDYGKLAYTISLYSSSTYQVYAGDYEYLAYTINYDGIRYRVYDTL